MELWFSGLNFQICAFYYCISVTNYFISLKTISSEKKKSCDIAFTKHCLFLWLAEKQLRNSSEEECLEKFRLPLLGDLLPLDSTDKSKILPTRLSCSNLIIASVQTRTSFSGPQQRWPLSHCKCFPLVYFRLTQARFSCITAVGAFR